MIFSLFKKKSIYVPTLLGYVFLTLVFMIFVGTLSFFIPTILTQSDTGYPRTSEKTKIAIVEGWMNTQMMLEAKNIILQNSYDLILVTGGQVDHDPEDSISKLDTYAKLGAWKLKKVGIDPDKIIAVDTETTLLNRTFSAGESAKKWLLENRKEIKNIDLITERFHSRRSHWMYSKALGDQFRLHTIPIQNPKLVMPWWKSSHGIKMTLVELASVLYSIPFSIFTH